MKKYLVQPLGWSLGRPLSWHFKQHCKAACLGLGLWLVTGIAWGHSFGQVYTLPVPFWLYAYGASAALIASFLVVGYFASAKMVQKQARTIDLTQWRPLQWCRKLRLLSICQVLVVLLFVLSIVSGFMGVQKAYSNFNMTFIWVVFVLGFLYWVALFGDWYAALNPWRTVCHWLSYVLPVLQRGIFAYPKALAYWPAVAAYMVFIYIELFSRTTPYSLAIILCVYSAYNFVGAVLFGIHKWFKYAEFFGVLLHLISKMAVVDYKPGRHLRLRMPFSGLMDGQASHMSVLIFILFMLSSTAFDGLHETAKWVRWFWIDFYQEIKDWVGHNPLAAYPKLVKIYNIYQPFWLVASPFIYWVIYRLFIALMQWVTRSELTQGQLALRFAYSLLPIVLVYHVSHYYTLVQAQAPRVLGLLSDPMGWGWDVFGTKQAWSISTVPDPTTVWHVQVLLIVLGHIVSVYYAHLVALTVFKTDRKALYSQLPMLLLMVAFTTVGLWVLSEPVKSGM